MTYKFTFPFGILLTLIFLLTSCSENLPPAHTYAGKVARGLKSGETHDSLFMGYHFGMDRQEYYDWCFALNKQQKLQQGSGVNVYTRLENELKHPAAFHFSADFYENEIALMNLKYRYDAWAPWNKDMGADSLLVDLQNYLKKEYGGSDFFIAAHPEVPKRKVYCKIDGNRQIILFKSIDESEVLGEMYDLRINRSTFRKGIENPVVIFE